ncbi:RNA polymerase I enhancer binding protein [Orbilia javanica]|uniref:RNA polymerase I enhancer binding protein n=1 Tax=Orbilia javanica TaxID=47235 RepID=A0AAN8RIU0_9PEZI
MLRSLWSFVGSTPQKSSQPSQQNIEADTEGSPTPAIEHSEQQLDMPSTPDRQSVPRYDGSGDQPASSPNTKRKRHKKKVKSSPISIVEVPATAEQPEERFEEEEGEEEEEGVMADVSNAEASAKRKRRKSDLELSEKKAKRPRKNKKSAEGGEQVVVNGTASDNEPGVEGVEGDEDHPYIPGVRWFGDVPGVLFEGSWVEADISQIEAIKKDIKAKKAARKERETEPEAVVEETDQEEREAERSRRQQKKRSKKTKEHHEPTPELEDDRPQPEPEAGTEADPEPAEANGEGATEDANGKQKKRRERKAHKQQETEVEARSEPGPEQESTNKERKRRKSTKDASEDSNRRRTYPRTAEAANPPKVIIPAAIDSGYKNSKGVGPPPPPAAYDQGPYTPTEDALIQSVVNRYCQIQVPRLNRAGFLEILWNNDRHKTDFWNILMTNLPLRTRQSLHSHVKRMYNDFEERGKWSQEQDDELRDLVAQKGTKWTVIGGLMNRMPEDCRDRWKNYVVCGEKRRTNVWDEDEIEKLLSILDDMLAQIVEGHEQDGTLVLPITHEDDEEEGRAARLKKEQYHHRGEIDWTIVSERMGHTRSRMQCLSKSKTLWERTDNDEKGLTAKKGRPSRHDNEQGEKKGSKRGRKKKQGAEEEEETEGFPLPALQEAKNMLPGDYFYILQRVSVQGYDCLASIDWNKLSETDPVKHFSPEQFKAGFHNYMKINNSQKKDLRTFVAEQLGELSELPGMIRNKRYRPPAGATSPAVATAPPTAEKGKRTGRQKNQNWTPINKPGLSAEAGPNGSSPRHSSPPRRMNRTEKPSHSPGNPFAKQPNGENTTPSSASRTRGKPSNRSPKKQYKSAEYIDDSSDGEGNGGAGEESGAQGGNTVNGANGVAGDAGVEEPKNGSEADDEMGESVAFGNASKDKGR